MFNLSMSVLRMNRRVPCHRSLNRRPTLYAGFSISSKALICRDRRRFIRGLAEGILPVKFCNCTPSRNRSIQETTQHMQLFHRQRTEISPCLSLGQRFLCRHCPTFISYNKSNKWDFENINLEPAIMWGQFCIPSGAILASPQIDVCGPTRRNWRILCVLERFWTVATDKYSLTPSFICRLHLPLFHEAKTLIFRLLKERK